MKNKNMPKTKKAKKVQVKNYSLHYLVIALVFLAVVVAVLSNLSVFGAKNTQANWLSNQKNPKWFVAPTPDPTSADKIPPTVAITTPAPGTVLSLSSKVRNQIFVEVDVNASDDVGVGLLVYSVNDSIMELNYSSNYKTLIGVPAQKGTYTIKVVAYDFAGLASQVATTNVVVN